MPVPAVTCSADIVDVASSLPRACSLGASATNSPTAWRWEMLDVPIGSTANVGSNGDFTDGVATSSNPTFSPGFTADEDGAYVCECRAQNGTGWSDPEADKEHAQQVVMIKTPDLALSLPGAKQYAWEDYLDETLRLLEAAGISGQTDTVAGNNGISNTGNNVDAVLEPSYGSAANTVCEGDDARLSDSRAPSGAASGQLGGTYPGPDVRGLRETGGPTALTMAGVADGQYLKRSGSTIVGAAGGSGGQTNTVSGTAPITNTGDNVDAVIALSDAGVTNAKLADMAQGTIKGRASGAGTGAPADLTAAQATAILSVFTNSLKGLVPTPGEVGTTKFLRQDVTWQVPSGGGGGFSGREQEYTAAGGDETFTLGATPATNANMLSGVNIIGVFRNGLRMRYQATPATALEYGYTAPTSIVCKSLTAGDIITVVYST